MLGATSPAPAQFIDPFTPGHDEPAALGPWRVFSGDGEAEISYAVHDGFARVTVDATRDRRNIWWAVFQNPSVADHLDMGLLEQPGYELRMEARVRSSHAPRRINLSFHSQRTTDFHNNLMEYDLPEANVWKTISLTTRGFTGKLGDRIVAQLAMIDMGRAVYAVDVDYIRVDVVRPEDAGPDLGSPVPYHPPVPDDSAFAWHLPAVADTTLDPDFPALNLNDWTAGGRAPAIVVGGERFAVLRWDFSALPSRAVTGPAVLELTTLTREKKAARIKDFGLVRVVEILRGDPGWEEGTLTYAGLLNGRPRDAVVNPQMIIDQDVNPAPGGANRWVISQPALQRLVSGETVGLAVLPLGPIHAAFYSREYPNPGYKPTLHLNVVD